VQIVLLRVTPTRPYKIIGKQKVFTREINKWGEVLVPTLPKIPFNDPKNFCFAGCRFTLNLFEEIILTPTPRYRISDFHAIGLSVMVMGRAPILFLLFSRSNAHECIFLKHFFQVLGPQTL